MCTHVDRAAVGSSNVVPNAWSENFVFQTRENEDESIWRTDLSYVSGNDKFQ